jgi:hypothetical protein
MSGVAAMQKALIFSRGYPIHPEDVSRAIGGQTLSLEAREVQADEIVRQWVRQSLVSGDGKDVFGMHGPFASLSSVKPWT